MNEVGSGCARCGSADGELYEWAEVSIHADEVVRLCQPCFQHALHRQHAAVEKNTIVLQSLKKRGMLADGFFAVGAVALVLIMLFLLATAWPNYRNNPPPDPYFPGAPIYSPVIGGGPPS